MNNFIIDACRWHVDAESPKYKERALEHFRDRYSVLLEFMRNEHLLTDPTFGENIENWIIFELKASDLTEEGFKLVKLCHGTWSPAFGQGKTQRHLIQWKRKLKSLRESAQHL